METNSPFKTVDNGKNAAIVSYFWFIGWLIAYFAMYKDNQTELSRYHLKQTLLFHLVSTVLSWGLSLLFIPIILATDLGGIYYILRIVQIGLFVLWIIGLIAAIQGEKKPIPLIGDKAQTMFPSI
ncbi:hypothetical protein ASE74_11240 [Pedobacter sp. Leaf216]|uniref:DUF4870 domain-containing protein n=1 Tax=Pedobacter sp. Leaf216 TaxID=1735684 RepID=UPI0006FEB5E2|nr:hypothetical protein [Pedobacter sp. Leaf216]KQM64587.1 hypothetical protein ASE74_11240 [Pedobacter sp. Leaf216]